MDPQPGQRVATGSAGPHRVRATHHTVHWDAQLPVLDHHQEQAVNPQPAPMWPAAVPDASRPNDWPYCLKTRSPPPQAACLRLRLAWLLFSTWRHSLASRSCPGAVPAPPLPHGQSTQTLRGQVLVPSADLGNLRQKIWLSSSMWAFSHHSSSAARGPAGPRQPMPVRGAVEMALRMPCLQLE